MMPQDMVLEWLASHNAERGATLRDIGDVDITLWLGVPVHVPGGTAAQG